MIIQLSPCIPVITPKGKALAHFVIDYSPEHHLHWVCFLDNNGECWTFQNPDIRAQKNETQKRDFISPFYEAENLGFTNHNFHDILNEVDGDASYSEFDETYTREEE